MKLNLEVSNRRAATLLALFLLFIIPMLIVDVLFPYKVLAPISVSHEPNYQITRLVSMIGAIFLLVFIWYSGYLIGVKKDEESIEEISD